MYGHTYQSTRPNEISPPITTRRPRGQWRPRFGPGELPVEYMRMDRHTVHSGELFGPLSFQISARSHENHLSYIKSVCNLAPSDGQRLLPFEVWPFARVLSRGKYGRLNELISIRGERTITGVPTPGEELLGTVMVEWIRRRNGLTFASFRSSTALVQTGQVCLDARDILLLAGDSEVRSIQRLVAESVADRPTAPCPPSELRVSLRMRFEWPDDKWRNNVHTRTYATKLGYDAPLIEGPALLDCLIGLAGNLPPRKYPIRINWTYRAPLYDGLDACLLRRTQSTYELRSLETGALLLDLEIEE